ncbi:MAG: multicomponent Na+:H+ antiporter subunit [Thermoproteota archaeon]|nr:multicomponent Na+:H+ antiporter subunit [Thermoproteota archaeon]
MNTKTVISLLVIISSLLAISYAIADQATGVIPQTGLRNLASFYLENTLNPSNKSYWTASPEATSAIVWDYRGFDTFFETSVFYLAIVGCTLVFELYEPPKSKTTKQTELGLTIIVKVITKIVGILIVCVSASIALHGQLTPGGGFQGGAALAVLPILFIITMSRFALDRKVNDTSMIIIRALGLCGIGITVILPLFLGFITNNNAYIIQNQMKPDALVSLPSTIADKMMGGSLWMLNVSEYIAVGAGFTLAFLLLSLPERSFKKILEEEKYATY